jgi:hypothetical protein
MDALAAGHDAAVQMINTSVVRAHQHEACIADNNHQDMGRSRGGLTSKIHAVVDTNGLPVHLSPSRRMRRTTIGCARFFSAHYFQRPCCSRIADTIRTGSGSLRVGKGAWANIPPKRNRIDPICFSPYLYRAQLD